MTLLAFGSMAGWASGNESDSPGQADDPGGNNGTVKVDEVEMDDHDPPSHTPHADCVFVVEFYGYDKDPSYTASVTFEFHEPTTRPQGSSQVILQDTVSIGEDAAGGGTDLDARKEYLLDLAGVEPHPEQGHKVKLTVHADGSQGNDVKHKVFWVSCPPPPVISSSTTTTTTTVPPTTTTTEATTTTTTTTTTPIAPNSVAVVQGAVEVRPSTTTTPNVQGVQESLAGGQLPRTGVNPMMLQAGLLSTLAGLSCLACGRRRRP